MLKMKLQYFSHLMQRTDSLAKTMTLGKIEGQRRRGQERKRWLNGITSWMDMSWASSSSWWWTGKPGVLQSVGSQRVRHDWATELILILIEVLIFLKKRACSLIGWWLLPVTNRTGSKSIAHREPLHYLATKGPTPHGQFSGDSSFSGFLILAWYDIGSSKL